MALIKILPTDFGMNAEYWRITNISSIISQGTTIVTLDGYFNKENRFNDAQPLRRHSVEIQLIDVTRPDAYTELKKSNILDGVEQNPFADALDDL
jgi:hypothetical protein